ncbi:fucosyltransferase (plasmid) [Bryobacterales bacterium F-183]|nr:fucosyltransferase [Bryobacterales bacterium F-183]
MKRFSVIVPLYNKKRYIRRCLDAILSQSFRDFEVIVVNDGSTDGSEQIVEQEYPSRVRLVTQPNAGPGSARNHGCRLAQSELYAFLDGDDAWEPNYLAESDAWFTAHPQAAMLTWCMRLFPSDKTLEESWRSLAIPKSEFQLQPDTPVRSVIGMLANMLPSSTVIRADAFTRCGGYYDKFRCLYSEDTHLWMKVLLNYPAGFDWRPLTLRFEDASELALNLKSVRPIEPFLLDPDDVRTATPIAMRPLLDDILAWRALKTASVYGYFGHPAKARELVHRFTRWSRDWRSPHFATALAGCTPAGGWIGTAVENWRARKDLTA